MGPEEGDTAAETSAPPAQPALMSQGTMARAEMLAYRPGGRTSAAVSTEDGGATWTQSKLKGGGGYAFGIDVLEDGSAGYAVTCSVGGMAGCAIWRYSP